MGDHGDLSGFLDRRSGSAVVSEDRQIQLMVARLWDSAQLGLADQSLATNGSYGGIGRFSLGDSQVKWVASQY